MGVTAAEKEVKTDKETIEYQQSSDSQTIEVKITNEEDKAVAFKVKCTNNNKFRIKPVMAILGPKDSTTVRLTCSQANAPDDSPKDRFVVFAIYSGDEKNARQIWSEAAKDKVEGKRKTLYVKFEGKKDEAKKDDEKKDDKKEEEKKDDKKEEPKKEEEKKEEKKDEPKKDDEKKDEKKEEPKKEEEKK